MSSKFCNLKYQQKVFILQLNSASSCCRAYPEPLLENETVQERIAHWKTESALLDQGVELANCESCWQRESQGKISHRQSIGQSRDAFNRVEIYLSNLCNQMCSYCSPKYSSVWEESIDQHGVFEKVSNTAIKNLEISKKNQSSPTRLTEIQSYIQTCDDNSIDLALLGGEPLMQLQSLQELLKFGQTKIKNLSIVTNLNPPKSKFLQWVLDNFTKDKLQIQISLDATPEYNHVPRAGFDSTVFQQNLTRLKDHEIKIKLLSTVSATSIFDLPNFLSWIKHNQFTASFASISNPGCLDPTVVPLHIRQEILKNIQTDVPTMIEQVLNSTQSTVDLKLFEQYNYLVQYFDRTATDLTKINNPLFQEYWQWLTERFQK